MFVFSGGKLGVSLCLLIAAMFKAFRTVTVEGFIVGVVKAEQRSVAVMGMQSCFTITHTNNKRH